MLPTRPLSSFEHVSGRPHGKTFAPPSLYPSSAYMTTYGAYRRLASGTLCSCFNDCRTMPSRTMSRYVHCRRCLLELIVPQKPYDAFRAMERLFSNLTMNKRAGKYHDLHVPNRDREDATVSCVTCPSPGFNLPDDLSDTPPHLRYVHKLKVATFERLIWCQVHRPTGLWCRRQP